MTRVPGPGPVRRARQKPVRAVTLLADGYEIMRSASGAALIGGWAHAILGKPTENGRMFSQWFMTRETFNAYREHGWIAKASPYVSRGWQCWRITDKGREEARRRSKPTRAEIKAATYTVYVMPAATEG